MSNSYKIIAKLTHSIVKDVVAKERVVDKYFGAFQSKKSAKKIILEIRNSRTFSRKIEAF